MSRKFLAPFTYTLLATSLALVTVGCNKKPASSTTTTNTTSSTSTTVATSTTAESSVTALAVDSATSATGLTPPTSATAATSATSATATTQIQGNPKDTVKNHIEALRAGNVKTAVSYIQTNDPKVFSEFLSQTLPQYKELKSVTYAEPQFNPEKTQARVVATFSGKSLPKPLAVPFLLVGTPTGWKILADTPQKTTAPATGKDGKIDTKLMTPQEVAALKASGGKAGVPAMPIMKDKNGKIIAPAPMPAVSASAKNAVPSKPRTAPIVVDTTKKGTPEDTVKQAMNTLMTGTPKESTKFYISKNPKLVDVVATQQALFQQNLQSMKIGDVKYNKNKTQADVNVLLMPLTPPPAPVKPTKSAKKSTEKAKPVPPPQPQAGVIKLEKKGGVWKILAD